MADRNLQILINARDQATGTIKKVQREIKKMGPEAKKASSDVASSTKSMSSSFGGLKSAIVGVIASLGAFAAIKGTISLTNELEQNTVAFTTMLGSAEQAQILLRDLSDFAATTPFELTGIRKTAKQLLAFGFNADELIPTLRSLGDVASGLGVPIEQIAYAYGQVRTANQLYGTELRQFMNAGVPLLAELADMFGVTSVEMKKMVETGKIGFKDVEKAFQNMSGEGGKSFNLMAKQAQTLGGMWSNLQDIIALTGEKIGTALNDDMKGLVDSIINFIGDNYEAIIDFAVDAATFTKDAFKSIFEVMKSATQEITGLITILTGNTKQEAIGIGQIFKALFLFIGQGIGAISIIINTAVRTVFGAFKAVGTGLGGFIFQATNFVKGLVKTMANNIIGGINKIINGINGVVEFLGGSALITPLEKFSTRSEALAIKNANTWEKTKEAFDFDGLAKSNQKILGNMVNSFEAYQTTLADTGAVTGTLATSTEEAVSGVKDAVDGAKKAASEAKDIITPMVKKFEESSKAVEKTREEIQKLSDKFVAFKAKGSRAILDVNKQILDLKNNSASIKIGIETGKTTDLSSRFVAITEKLKELKESQREAFSVEDAAEIKKLKQEQLLIEQNVTKEALDQAVAYSKVSEAQVIIDEANKAKLEEEKRFALEKEKLEEKKKLLEIQANQNGVNDLKVQTEIKDGILTAFYNDEQGRQVQIKDYENILQAEKLVQKQLEFQQETNMLLDKYETQKQAQIAHLSTLKGLWSTYNQNLTTETASTVTSMISQYSKLEAKLKRIIALRAQAGGSSSVSGARALGGNVASGRTYLVGERGPELFTAPGAGNIVPNKNLGGGGGTTVNINVTGNKISNEADENRLAQKIKDSLARDINLARNFGIA